MFGKTVALKSICSMTLYHLSCTIYLIFWYQSLIKSCFFVFQYKLVKISAKVSKTKQLLPWKTLSVRLPCWHHVDMLVTAEYDKTQKCEWSTSKCGIFKLKATIGEEPVHNIFWVEVWENHSVRQNTKIFEIFRS